MTAFVDLDTIHVPATGDALPASWGLQINANMDHFNELELLTCTSGTRPGSPVTNKLIRETDTADLLVWNGSAWVVINRLGAGTTFTPTLVQSGAVTKTINRATYTRDGRRIRGETHLAVTGSGTTANAITVGLPVTSASLGGGTPIIGVFWCYDASGSIGYHGALVQVSTTAAVGWAHGLTGNIGVTPNFALASSDQVGYMFSYEAAS